MSRAICFILLLCTAFAVPAQSDEALRAEIVFWETIRASTDPADFRAYLEQYPNGKFAALARNRLRALAPAATPQAPVPQASIPQPPRPAPSAVAPGDRWTYRLLDPRSGAQRATHDVSVASIAGDAVVEDILAGGAKLRLEHRRGYYLMPVADLTVFSPYLIRSTMLPLGPFRGVDNLDSRTCNAGWTCSVRGNIIGRERVTVPAGTFNALRVEVYQNWISPSQTNDRGENVSRTITVWYADEAKRAVRITGHGARSAWVETEFELELVSYQVK